MLFTGCAVNPTSVTTQTSSVNFNGMTLDQAIAEAAIRIEERITAGSKIALLNFNSTSDRFSSYVLDELTANLVENGKLIVVDRSEIDLIRSEFDFQYSGEVGDDSMQALGRMLGAQSIISGSLTDMGGFYRIMIRVLNVQNASVEVQYRTNIVSDHVVTALLTGGRTTTTEALVQSSQSVTFEEAQNNNPVVTTQTQLIDPSIPIPSNIIATAESYSAIQISWRAAPSVLGYNLYVATASNGAYTFLANTNELSYLHENLEPNVTRFYRLSAVGNSGRESPLSTVVSVTTRQISIPTGLTVTPSSANEINLTWLPVEGAAFYRVYGSTSIGGPQNLIISTSDHFFNHTGLQQNTTYHYRVSAVIGEWESGQSVTANARTPQIPITPLGDTILQQLAWIGRQGGNGTVYEIIVNNNVNIGPTTIMSMGVNATVIIRSASTENIRIIQLDGQGYLFSVAGITLQLQDIELRGHSNNNRALILVDTGKLVLNSGAKITGNTNTGNPDRGGIVNGGYRAGGGIIVNAGVLEINDGAEISGNTVIGERFAAFGGGIFIENRSTVIMRGGIIARNRAGPGGWGNWGSGGGIYILDSSSSFTKQATSGNFGSGIIYGSIGDNANITGGNPSGNAIYFYSGSSGNSRYRNTTLGPGDEITTTSNVGWGQ